MSRTVTTGKSRPQGLPVSALIEDGPLEPMQLPITFGQMTKYRSVSIGRPGPTMVSHQPGFFGDRMHARRVLVAGERVADQHRV